MKIEIVKADTKYTDDCVQALVHSDIGRAYFSDHQKAQRVLTGAVQRGEISVALSVTGECVGFIWYLPDGVFGNYPYLHVIAVKETCRNQGIGKQLLFAVV